MEKTARSDKDPMQPQRKKEMIFLKNQEVVSAGWEHGASLN